MMFSATLSELFAIPGVQRSACALVVAALSLPIIGVLIIGLDIITVRFAVMHVALFGIAIGLWTGLPPYALALGLCAITGAALAPLAGRPGGLAGPMSFLMTMAAAAALLVLSISGVNANGAFEILWGSILATRPFDLVTLSVVAAAVVTLYLTLRRPLALLLFDRELAMSSGIAVTALTSVSVVMVAVSIGSAIRLTGALLVDSVTLLPALAARNVARSMRSMVAWAVGFGLVGNSVGFLLALHFDQPPGPTLVLVAGVLALGTFTIRPGRREARQISSHT